MNIDEMPAGRELDALVAERVIGQPYVLLPHYSTDIAAAKRIAKKLEFLIMPGDDETSSLWYVASLGVVNVISSTVNMMPLTICRAALKLMEGK